MKKWRTVFIACAVGLCAAVTVSAASGLNDNERQLLDQVKAEVEASVFKGKISEDMFNQAENYLNRDDVDVTAEQTQQLTAKIEEAKAILEQENVTSIDDFKGAVKEQVLTAAQDAAAVLSLTLNYETVNQVITVTDQSGAVVFKAEDVIKRTGPDMGGVVAAGGVLTVILAGCAAAVVKGKQRQ